jgi:hypothetical protein
MFSVLRRFKSIPRNWGPNENKNKRELLIKYVQIKHPEIPIEKIIKKIDSLNNKEFNESYNLYVK